MEYILMHKNKPVLDLEIDGATGSISKTGTVHNITHLPIGTHSTAEKNNVSRNILNDWWTGRSIPASRDGLKDVLLNFGVCSPVLLLDKCYGLSLSDQYWVCPENSDILWETVNFFQNDFSKDVGEVLFGHKRSSKDTINFMSPDNTSDGWLKKKWIIADGNRYLMKGGSGFLEQEPFNEVIASALMRRLNISHVEYTLTFEQNKPYSLCKNFITPETELIPAWRIMQTRKKNNSHSELTHFFLCCEKFGIPNVWDSIDKMLTLDYIISNEDRHYNNYGAIRNAETLEWLGLAPVYDSGTSLWHTTPYIGSVTNCKPFKKTHNDQIKLVKDLSWFDIDVLNGINDEIIEILSESKKIDTDRSKRLAGIIVERALKIRQMAANKKH
jgi:hypothetical protein